MAFGKLFGRKSASAPEAEHADAGADEESADAPDESLVPEEDVSPDEMDRRWTDRALGVLPGGSSTGSKQPSGLYGRRPAASPTHYVHAHGCTVTTAGGQSLIDLTMALGAVSLGYGDEAITRAVLEALANGQVSGLAHISEVDVAERLCDVIPCAERVRFLKSGAEAVSAAVRIARVATGRPRVVCSGYFGWHDWSSEGGGIPSGATEDVVHVPFDDEGALLAAVRGAGGDLACIVLEPVVERLPSREWLVTARDACDRAGAVLVFDELKTGFRLAAGGYQAVCEVTPDLAAFGKAMAGGLPVAAVVGKAGVMEAARKTWISSTLAGEAGALAAVAVVLDRYAELDVCAALARTGAQIRSSCQHALAASGAAGVEVAGLDPMWFLRFEEPVVESRFLEHAAGAGLLVKRGPYNYAALAHDDEEVLLEIERRASTAFVDLVEALENEDGAEA
jgi:glutamate-1-semialdehyde aminotransferase